MRCAVCEIEQNLFLVVLRRKRWFQVACRVGKVAVPLNSLCYHCCCFDFVIIVGEYG